MEVVSKSETVDEKKQRLGNRLFELKDKWPAKERTKWCVENDCNSEAVKNSYMRGKVPKIPVAEKLIEAIEKYMNENNIAA